jgi:aldose 1-epimerase
VRSFRLQREGGIALTLTDRGATWLDCEVPLADGSRRPVILRRAGITESSADKFYLGATVGRYANRIAQARIRLGGQAWPLTPNPGSPHQLHGGPEGFHSRSWDAQQLDETAVRFSLRSRAGDQGYPGDLDVQVTYALVDAMTIEMRIVASTDAPTPLAITNHAYFNLDGDAGDIRDHRLRVNAARYMPVDDELIPFGAPQPVQGTSFDFREATPIGARWLADEQQQRAEGYDHAFLLDERCASLNLPAAELRSRSGDLRMSIATDMPALQLYAGQQLRQVTSPSGAPYARCAGVALEPGWLPDSPNHPEWPQPSCWLLPGALAEHVIRWRFTGR